MNLRVVVARLVLFALVSIPCAASAVCLDPKTLVSGYKIPLVQEVRAADAIVVGRVLSEKGLKEDPADPAGDTAYDLTIMVSASLKGDLPRTIVIRNDNTSARYPVAVGEEHIFFISRAAGHFTVNSCGNSTVMPEGKRLFKQVQRELRQPQEKES